MRKLVIAMLLAAAPALAQTPAPATAPAAPPETVSVQAAPLSDTAIQSFVRTYTAPSLMTGKIPRWAHGICVRVQGLPQELAEGVASRIKTVIGEIKAPLAKDPCDLNAAIFFDANPQEVLDDIAARAPELLGYHEAAQARKAATISHPAQAWYATGTRDLRGNLQLDVANPNVLCDTGDTDTMSNTMGLSGGMRIDPNKYNNVLRDKVKYCGNRFTTGNRVKDGLSSEIATVTIVASMDTVRYHELAAVADYLSLLILSQTEAFATCQQIDTVANLLIPGCDPGNRIKGLTLGDMAYLKALYRSDPGGTLAMQQQEIAAQMKKTLAER
jgi:hypothetical protein